MKTRICVSSAAVSISLLALASTTRSFAAFEYYYGGDGDFKGNFASYFNSSTLKLESMVFDDFSVSQNVSITRLWGNFSSGSVSFWGANFGGEEVQAYYEILDENKSVFRSGYFSATPIETGRFNTLGQPEYLVGGSVGFLLPQGSYWMGIAPVSGETLLVSTTTGQNLPGTETYPDHNPDPLGLQAGNSFRKLGSGEVESTDPWDFSYGIEGAAVPEPSTFIAGALLALPFGLQGLRYLRNRKRAV